MKRLFVLCLLVSFVGCAPKKEIVTPEPPILQEQERLERLQKELERLQKENLALADENKALSSENEVLNRRGKDLERRIMELEKERKDLVKKIEEDRIKSEEELKRLKEENERIRSDLERYIEKGRIEVKEEKRGVVITLLDTVLFDTGKAKIKKEGIQILNKVAEIIKKYKDRGVVVEGHTDSVPICNWRYPSNWELSTRRATEVVKFFIKRHNISPLRLQAVGYGEYRPIATNETEEGRRRNRRVEIILLPEDYLREVTTFK